MTQSFTTQSLQKVLGYPFRDPEWKNKLLIASALVLAGSFIPLVPLIFVYGYGAEIMRRVIVSGEEPGLPVWEDWGRLALDGLKWWGVSLIYALPALAVGLVGMGVCFGFSWMPLWMGSEPPLEAVAAPMAAMAVGAAALGLSSILSLAAGLLTPPAFGHVLATAPYFPVSVYLAM